MDKKNGVGNLSCKVCGQSFQTGINCTVIPHPYFRPLPWLKSCSDLSAAVDVYAEWIDACDAVADKAAENANYRTIPAGERPARAQGAGDPLAEGDGFIVDDEAEGEADFIDDD